MTDKMKAIAPDENEQTKEFDYKIASKIIADVLEQEILRTYPNPNRIGCRGSAILRKMAQRRLPHEDPFWDRHVQRCSPCYGEFLAERKRVLKLWHRRERLFKFTIDATIGLALGAFTYWILR